jgi:hypothetical protein
LTDEFRDAEQGCCCWCLLALRAALNAQLSSRLGTGSIEQIEVRHVGPPAVSDDLVRAHIRVKEGDTYSLSAATSDVRALEATGYFRDVRVAADRTERGIQADLHPAGKAGVDGDPVRREHQVQPAQAAGQGRCQDWPTVG